MTDPRDRDPRVCARCGRPFHVGGCRPVVELAVLTAPTEGVALRGEYT